MHFVRHSSLGELTALAGGIGSLPGSEQMPCWHDPISQPSLVVRGKLRIRRGSQGCGLVSVNGWASGCARRDGRQQCRSPPPHRLTRSLLAMTGRQASNRERGALKRCKFRAVGPRCRSSPQSTSAAYVPSMDHDTEYGVRPTYCAVRRAPWVATL